MPKLRSQSKPWFADFLRRILLGWLIAVVIEYCILPSRLRDLAELRGLAQMSLARVTTITGVITALLTVRSHFAKPGNAERWGIAAAFAILAFTALQASATWAFFAACALVLTVLTVFAIRGWENAPEPAANQQKANKAHIWITAGLSAAFFLFVSAWTVGRVYSFCSPTYDFGIFSQMFYNMKASGLPMTTVERDGLLSHFAVHVSPIYYLMLPFYALFPAPATLQVLQAAVLTSAVIPLWLIGKHHGLTGAQRMLVCMLLLLYPAYAGGTGYDIHENCFLTPLILWLFYGIDRKSPAITAVAAVLTLMVKEDAAVYVAVIGLWVLCAGMLRKDGKRIRTGTFLLAGSLGWFFLVTGYLAKNGDGVMTYRYNNFLYDGSSSLMTVILSVILNPMKAVYECADPEKLRFIALTLFPLLGLPLLTRRYERYILLIPYVLVNLMSDYTYQHDIFFQYTFGSAAFLLYLTVVNLAEWKHRLPALLISAMLSVTCFGMVIVPTAVSYPVQAVQYSGYYDSIRNTLSQIPEDASVTAGTFYTAALSQREVLYDIGYASVEHLMESDYVVVGKSSPGDYERFSSREGEDGYENLVQLLKEHGFTLLEENENGVVIFKRATVPSPE